MKSGISIRAAITGKLNYEIEAVSQVTASLIAGIDYGIVEAWWIPTGSLGLPIFGRFSYYHVGLVVLMLVVSSALAWSHLQWILDSRRKYVICVCSAAIPLSLLVEDITWFVTKGQPIRYNEWTMIHPGWGINAGFTWIPFWYILVFSWSAIMLELARKYADKGYRAYLKQDSPKTLKTSTQGVRLHLDDFMKFVAEIASYLLGAEAIVLTIVYVVAKPPSLPIAASAVLLVLAILTCVLVLTGAINSTNPDSVRWKEVARLASNFTVWFFAGSLIIIALVIIWGYL
jgi:hypothetical protein